jgi:hypothetical protein
VHRESVAYLKLKKPRFSFLEGSGGAAVTPVVATVALAGAPAVLAGASAVRAASSTDRLAAGACSTATSAACGDRCEGFHLSGGPVALLFLLLRRR